MARKGTLRSVIVSLYIGEILEANKGPELPQTCRNELLVINCASTDKTLVTHW